MTDVVYIDDEPQVCRVFEIHMERRQMDVKTFTDPNEAMSFINANEVRAVFCDYRMPQMTGAELLARLNRDLPFFIVTGGLQAYSDTLLEERGIPILAKPVDYGEVEGLIQASIL